MFTIDDARTIIEMAYTIDEHTGLKVPGLPELIIKLYQMFPELKNDFIPLCIQRILGLDT